MLESVPAVIRASASVLRLLVFTSAARVYFGRLSVCAFVGRAGRVSAAARVSVVLCVCRSSRAVCVSAEPWIREYQHRIDHGNGCCAINGLEFRRCE